MEADVETASETRYRVRPPVGRPKKTLDTLRILELRSAGKSWPEIARICRAGVTTVRRAYRAVDSERNPTARGVTAQ